MRYNFFLVRKTILIIAASFFTFISFSQDSKRSIVDYGRKFYYNKEEGITPSYISTFGNSFLQEDLHTVSGKTLFKDSLKKKVVVYNFWFTKCQPCISEMPGLNKLYEKFISKSDSVEFIAITFNDTATIRTFLEKKEFLFNIASLSQPAISKMKKISYYPMTFIINRRQQISYAFFGRVGGKNSDDELSNLLESKLMKALKE